MAVGVGRVRGGRLRHSPDDRPDVAAGAPTRRRWCPRIPATHCSPPGRCGGMRGYCLSPSRGGTRRSSSRRNAMALADHRVGLGAITDAAHPGRVPCPWPLTASRSSSSFVLSAVAGYALCSGPGTPGRSAFLGGLCSAFIRSAPRTSNTSSCSRRLAALGAALPASLGPRRAARSRWPVSAVTLPAPGPDIGLLLLLPGALSHRVGRRGLRGATSTWAQRAALGGGTGGADRRAVAPVLGTDRSKPARVYWFVASRSPRSRS